MLRVDATMLTNLKCCGKGSAQSADFIDAARRMVEASTAAPSLFLSGAAGDVNPVERGGGSAAANAMGKRLGAAIVTALLPTALLPTAPLPTALLPTASTPPQPKQQRLSPAAADSAKSRFDGWLADVKLSTHSITARVPLEALPTTATAAAFLEQQRDWLAATRAASDGASSGEGGGGGEGAGGGGEGAGGGGEGAGGGCGEDTRKCPAAGPPSGWPSSLPMATCEYAERLMAASHAGRGSDSTDFGVCVLALGPGLVLVGLEAEVFSEYALHFNDASPFEKTITIG